MSELDATITKLEAKWRRSKGRLGPATRRQLQVLAYITVPMFTVKGWDFPVTRSNQVQFEKMVAWVNKSFASTR